MTKRRTLNRKAPRDTTRVVPYLYHDRERGIRVYVSMVRYYREPTGATVARPEYVVPRTTLAEIKSDVDTLLTAERHRDKYLVPTALKPQEPITVAPLPREPYRPPEMREDFLPGVAPKGYDPSGDCT